MAKVSGRLEEIKNNIFAVIWADDDSVDGGFGANQGFVILEDSVLVFDSGISLRQARLLDRSIRSVTDKKVKFLVNSHDHSDHVFGNSFFSDAYSKSGLIIISHRLCSEQIIRFGPKRMKGYRRIPELKTSLDPLRILVPNVTYSNLGIGIEIEGTELVFVHPPTGAHTLGDTYLCLPDSGVLFSGDVVWNRYLPNLEDANLEGWISTLDDLDLTTYSKCLPGHGEVCRGEDIRAFHNYLKSVRDKLVEVDTMRDKDPLVLRSCFEIPGTEDWRLRSIVDYNIKAILHLKE